MLEISTELNGNKRNRHATLPRSVFKDGVKWILIPTKIILDYVCLWPENFNKITTTLLFLMVTSTVLILIGEIQFISENSNSFTKTISGVSIFVVSIEVTIKN